MKILSIVSIVLFSVALNAQSYRIYFSDKGENEYMLQNPYTFLSPEAVDNKAKRGTAIDLTDVPVAESYLQTITDLELTVKMKSRWFNYALVEGEDIALKVAGLPFVKKVEKAGKYKVHFAGNKRMQTTSSLVYGESANQIEMVNGDYLHDLNSLGQGMTIAVLDGGFAGVDVAPGFDSLRMSGRLLGSYDFVQNDTDVYEGGSHGTNVLSIMAAYVDSQFVGTALRANYWLLKSENESSEYAVEMDNWVAAAEFADSVGADIITSSLGYNTFNDGVGDLDYSDMDGNTALVTRAADMAAKKGLLVIVSAGNEGNTQWEHILAPADGDSVLTIGGVDESGNYVSFASKGPTADGRIKPDVSARALGTAFVSTSVNRGNGTSYSCPVISGLAACLWQQHPTKTNMEIYEAIRTSASHYYTPNNQVGFGVANFAAASWKISNPEESMQSFKIDVFPNPVKDEFSVVINGYKEIRGVDLKVIDIAGREIFHHGFEGVQNGELLIEAPKAAGTYILSIRIGDEVYLRKIIK